MPCGQGSRTPHSATQGHRRLKENKATRAFPVLEEEPSSGKTLGFLYLFPFPLFFFVLFLIYSFTVYVQAIQEVSVAEEWVNDTQNKARVEVKLCVEANRALGACEQKNKELTKNVDIEHNARLSAETGLKNAKAQAEDQLQQLHIIEIGLATQRQLVLKLKAELEKAKEEARMARKASEAVEMASFERGVLDTEVRFVEEVAGVCKDYYIKIWAEALN